VPGYLKGADRAALLAYLASLAPLWEQRFSTVRGPPPGEEQRGLLRPVYWLGNWQFACLGYYEPPRNRVDCAVQGEPYPPVLAKIVADIEGRVRRVVSAKDVPPGWTLNTCLINFYGARRDGDGELDVARVGAHKDYEPGPVASLSLGERALFQFVRRGRGAEVEHTMWLDDGALQMFGGSFWKDSLLHRVQRVEDKRGLDLPPRVEGFRTRRINLTFRYVPPADIVAFARLGAEAREDVRGYVAELASRAPFWRDALAAAPAAPASPSELGLTAR
jgi:alkylated DNA repair dioxygenase AlkB